MSDHPDVVTIDAYVEELLDPAERARVREHLHACERCRVEVARQTSLLARLREAPDRIPPGADLRPAIRAEIERRERRRSSRAALRSLRVPLAAAAVLLVALTATVTTLMLGDRRTAEYAAQPRVRPEVTTAADFRDAQSRYVSTAAELSTLLERHRDALDPETVALVEESLRAIDDALREADAALRDDPASPILRDMILATHERKVEVLRWANELAGRT